MKYLLYVLITGIVIIAIPTAIWGAELRMGEQPSVAQNERIQDDVYMTGGAVRSAGTVQGDLFAAGGSVLINGAVTGDVIAAGGSITILGTIGDDLRVGGGNIVINAPIAGDALIGGGQVQLSGDGVGGDVLIGGGVVRIDAPIKGDVRIGGGDVVINAPVSGSVRFEGDKLTLGSAAVIAGDLIYRSSREVQLETGATVRGKTTYEPRENVRDGVKSTTILSLGLFGKFLAILMGALLIGLIFRRYAHELIKNATTRPLMEIGRGFITIVVLPIASVIVCITLIGIPIGILGIIAFIALLIFSCLTVPIILGSVVYKWIAKTPHYETSWKTILIGAVLYSILGLIPFIGWIVNGALILLALGATVGIKATALRGWR